MAEFKYYYLDYLKSKIDLDRPYLIKDLERHIPDFIIPKGASIRLDNALFKLKEMNYRIVFTTHKLKFNRTGECSDLYRTITISFRIPKWKNDKVIGNYIDENYDIRGTLIHEISHGTDYYDEYFSPYDGYSEYMRDAKHLDFLKMKPDEFLEIMKNHEEKSQRFLYNVVNDYSQYISDDTYLNADALAKIFIGNTTQQYTEDYGQQYTPYWVYSFNHLKEIYSEEMKKKNISLDEIIYGKKVEKGFFRKLFDNYTGGIEPEVVKDTLFSIFTNKDKKERPRTNDFIKALRKFHLDDKPSDLYFKDVDRKIYEEFLKRMKKQKDAERNKVPLSIWPPKKIPSPGIWEPLSGRKETPQSKFRYFGPTSPIAKPWWTKPFHPKISKPYNWGLKTQTWEATEGVIKININKPLTRILQNNGINVATGITSGLGEASDSTNMGTGIPPEDWNGGGGTFGGAGATGNW